MIELKGITWDHIRGINPLKASSSAFEKAFPGVVITWDVRSLEDFEDFPVEILAEKYDLIMLDHPFIGTGVEKRVIEPLDHWISQDFLNDQKENSVGGSYDSYNWDGKQWALAVDAAAQVSAYRSDLLLKLEIIEPPSDWNEIFRLAMNLPDYYKIGIPLNFTHSYCSFITLSANIGGNSFLKLGDGFDYEVCKEALTLLKQLIKVSHPASANSNPIKILDIMSTTNEIIYVPLIFGYSNYARSNYKKYVINFSNIPSFTSEPRGSILGGVGIALSSKSLNKELAVNYMRYVASKECQCGVYTACDGQPSYRKAWLDEKNNDLTSNFFANTLNTLDLSYIRPRYYGYSDFQKKAGEVLYNFLLNDHDLDYKRVINDLDELHKQTFATQSN